MTVNKVVAVLIVVIAPCHIVMIVGVYVKVFIVINLIIGIKIAHTMMFRQGKRVFKRVYIGVCISWRQTIMV